MQATQTDLSALRRGLAPPVDAEPMRVRVPMPPIQWRTRVALPAIIFAGAAGLLLYAGRDVLTPALDVHVVPVVQKISPAGQAAATRPGQAAPTAGPIVTAPGWVEADPYSTAVSALTNGVVAEVLVLEGEKVEVDQVVARLVDEDARLGLRQAEAELKSAEAALAETRAVHAAAQRDWDNPIELTRRAAAAKAGLEKAEAMLAQWPAEVAAADAVAQDKNAEYERIARLGQQASEIETIRSRLQYESARAEAEAIRLSRPARIADVASMKAELAAADADLRLRIADRRALDEAAARTMEAEARVAKAIAMRDIAALELDRMHVRSPYAGIVMARLVEPGSKVMFNSDGPRMSQIVRLYDPEHLQVRVDIPLSEAARVGVGDAAEIVVQVLPDRTFKGEVTRLVHEADIQRNTIQVKVRIDDPTPELKPEMLARARFLGHAAGHGNGAPDSTASAGAGGLFAPASAIRDQSGDKAVAWIVDQKTSSARRRAVELGYGRSGEWIEIATGLAPGDRLIVGDVSQLTDGRRVRVVGEAALASADTGKEAGHGSH
ncbi:MAG: efflux RND transporter periplasmic adaptor subunit [Alphaproteobacteria bacterium]